MKTRKFVYRCSSCGHEEPKWLGRCPECGEWRRNGEAILLDTTAFPRYLWVMDKVAEELGGINKTLAEIRDLLRSPKGKLTNVLETVVLIAGALGILHIVEIIRQWITGGM